MADNKKNKKGVGTPAIIAAIVLIFLIVTTIAEGKGFDLGEFLGGDFSKKSSEAADEMSVTFVDVGQGDCTYISVGGQNMLIDCGEVSASEDVQEFLDSNGVKRIDYLVGTHPHSDHMGGFANIIWNYDIGEVIIPHLNDDDIPTTVYFQKFMEACSDSGLEITEAELGRNIELGDADARIIAPNSDDYGNANNYSIGIMLTHGENSFLFTGDAERLAEGEMLENGMLGHADVFKAAHHCSDTANSEEFLEVVTPEYAVISCSENNSYGHPHKEPLERLRQYTSEIYITYQNGDITFKSDGKDLQVTTEW